jgi:uncharacterized protein YjdB
MKNYLRIFVVAIISLSILLLTACSGGGNDNPTPPQNIAVTGVVLDRETLNLNPGDSRTLSATVSPSNATNKAVTWLSSNPAVAMVTNGLVTAIANGTTTIAVVTTDGGKMATCTVTVSSSNVPVTGVTLSIMGTLSLTPGNSYTLTATVSPSNATNQTVVW